MTDDPDHNYNVGEQVPAVDRVVSLHLRPPPKTAEANAKGARRVA